MSAKLLIIATGLLMASGATMAPAIADAPRQAGQQPLRAAVMFNLLDANGDGSIGKDEASAVTAAIFAALDADSDGKLTKDELGDAVKSMHMGGGRGHRHGAHDDDGPRGHMGRDGRFGRGEGPHGMMGGMMQGMMQGHGDDDDTAGGGPGGMMGPGADQAGPGGMMQGMMQGHGDDDDSAGGGPGAMMGQDGARGPMHNFAAFDTNGDGAISQEEFDAAVSTFPGMGPAR